MIGIEAEAHIYNLDKNLNEHRIDIQGQKPTKLLRNATKTDAPTKEGD